LVDRELPDEKTKELRRLKKTKKLKEKIIIKLRSLEEEKLRRTKNERIIS